MYASCNKTKQNGIKRQLGHCDHVNGVIGVSCMEVLQRRSKIDPIYEISTVLCYMMHIYSIDTQADYQNTVRRGSGACFLKITCWQRGEINYVYNCTKFANKY